MPFRLEMLWTDWLVWLLVGVAVVYALYVRRHAHLAAPWLRVARSHIGMAAVTVLSVFIAVGLLDSVHFRFLKSGGGRAAIAEERGSMLDLALAGLRAAREKTYSAPLATHLFAKEAVTLPDGREVRQYPKLAFGGAHLEQSGIDRRADVLARAVAGAGAGLAGWLALAALLCAGVASHRNSGLSEAARAVLNGETVIAWRAVLAAALAVLLVAGPLVMLAAKYHVFGTDKIGQDVLLQALKSIRTGMVIGTLTTLVMLPFALMAGIMAGYFRGWVDDLIQYVYTTLSSIPGVLLIAAAVLMMQVYIETHPDWFQTTEVRADARLLALCMILGVTSWTSLCRLLRGEALKLRELEYIQAAHAFAVPHLRIMTRHLLPNVMHIVLISVVMDFSGLVLAEAVLSYVGVGVDPSTISFGTMINNARLEMAREPMVWWSLAAAFVFMLLLVLSANLFADAVRDAFDPRVRVARAGAFAFRQA